MHPSLCTSESMEDVARLFWHPTFAAFPPQRAWLLLQTCCSRTPQLCMLQAVVLHCMDMCAPQHTFLLQILPCCKRPDGPFPTIGSCTLTLLLPRSSLAQPCSRCQCPWPTCGTQLRHGPCPQGRCARCTHQPCCPRHCGCWGTTCWSCCHA